MISRRYLCSFVLGRKSAGDAARVKCRVKWNGSRSIVDINVGFVVDPDKWDSGSQRCVARTFHGKRKIPAAVINSEIERFARAVDETFAGYLRADFIPAPEKVKTDLRSALGIEAAPTTVPSVERAYMAFFHEQSEEKSWSLGMQKKLRTVGHHLKDSEAFETMDDFTRANLERYVRFLREDLDMIDTTLEKQMGYLRWFLRWADRKGWLKCQDYRTFRPKVKTPQKDVVFLTWDELMRVWNYHNEKFPSRDQARDLFCFCAFTSLRISDAAALTWADVYGDAIHVITKKTDDPLVIDLNRWSSEILERRRPYVKKNGKVFTATCCQVLNRTLKEIAFECGIDTPTRVTTYKAGVRSDDIVPKWTLISSHTARRTFICNALMMGIAPTTVMQWTGHSDYRAMKPYIAVADSERKKSMALFDSVPSGGSSPENTRTTD